MDQDVQPDAEARVEPPDPAEPPKPAKTAVSADEAVPADEVDDHDEDQDDEDHAHDERVTRVVHVVVGLVIAALAGWLLYKSGTELAFRGPNGEPGPGYLPVLLTICLVVLGLALSAVWLFGPKARNGEAPTLSLSPSRMGRALLVWLALVVCAFLVEPLGFLIAGEVLCLMVILVIERIRSIPLIITLLLLPLAMYFLFDTLLEVQLPGGTLWY
jgi:putative tricarboxylic transport membrane protein